MLVPLQIEANLFMYLLVYLSVSVYMYDYDFGQYELSIVLKG